VPLNLGVLSTNRSNEQSIASKSPISPFLMVALPRRLDECNRSSGQLLLAMGARSGAGVGGLGWTVVLSNWSFSSFDVLGRDLMATRAWPRGAQLSPMKCWNGAPQTAARSASISVVLENSLPDQKSARTSNGVAVATSNEE
jgi:hypothetical protein